MVAVTTLVVNSPPPYPDRESFSVSRDLADAIRERGTTRYLAATISTSPSRRATTMLTSC